MKLKLFLLTASAMVLATSCSSDTVVEENNAANAIQFSATANKASRAADYYCNANLPADFQVWASVGGKQYFANETYAKGEGSTYSITGGVERYWPNEEISFWAAKNYDKFNWYAAAASTMEFAPKANAKDQKDLLYAYTKSNRGANSNFNEGKANLNFRHALSQVVFYALNENSKIYVEVENISLCNAAKDGVFTLPVGTETTNANVENHGQGGTAATTGLGTWELTYNTTAIQKYTADCTVAGALVALDTNKKNLTDNATESEFGQSLLVLPQTNYGEGKADNNVAAWAPVKGTAFAANSGAAIAVKCKIRNVAGNAVADDDVYLYGTKDAAEELYIPCDFNWEQGKKYIYTIKFTKTGHAGYDPDGNDVLIPIEFNVTVDDFAAKSEQNVEI